MKSKIITLAASILLVTISCSTRKLTEEAPRTNETTMTLTPELAEGKNLYEKSCTRCHKLYNAKKFTQEEWKPILTRMQKKAKLDDTKMALISNYITSQL